MMNQKKQDRINKDVKKLVLGKTRYHNGTWGIMGYEITAKKSKKKVRKPLVDFKVSQGKHGTTNIKVDYPDSWNKIFGGGKKSKSVSKKASYRTKTAVRDVTNEKLLR
jgi:hypothetical protein